jgi:PPE-repeat protein
MDFASLPPEINSTLIYTGPGSGPMLAAAAAWDTLAAELHSTASLYQSVVTGLTAAPWLGPASAAMATAVAPYVAWTRITAAQAEQTANQATAAAAAYDLAFAETVPPPVVAANRALLMALVATNFFGQNTPAIATTETQYAEMWAQDTAAMFGYAGASAAATELAPFTSPPSSTNSGGQASQAAAVAQSAGTSAGNVQGTVSNAAQAMSAIPSALSNLASPAAALPALTPLQLLDLLADLSGIFIDPEVGSASLFVDGTVGVTALPYDVGGYYVGLHTDDIVSGWAGIETWPGMAPVPPTPFPVITNLAGGSAASAGLGEAKTIGALSVPSGWTAAAPEVRLAATALPVAGAGAAAEASAGSAGSLFSQMALASMAGRAMAGTAGGGGGGSGGRERIGERVGAATRKPAQPPQPEPTEPPPSPPGGPITGIAAELRELAALRDSGILTDEEFTEQKKRLLPH